MLELLTQIDWSWAPVLFGVSFGGGSGGGGNSTTSTSSERTGLFEPQAQQLSSFLAPQYQSTFFPYTGQRASNPTQASSLPSLDPNGLFPSQQAGFGQSLRDATSAASGNLAQRGFVRPENTQEAAAQGMAAVLPGYLNQTSGNIQQVSQYGPQVQAQTATDYLAALQSAITGVGGQSSQITTSTSSGGSRSGSGGVSLANAIAVAGMFA